MEELFNPHDKFADIIDNIETLKSQYDGVLASFSYKEPKEKLAYMRRIKNQVYSLTFETWKIDRIWECLNDYEELEVLERLK